jgi:hypothetical protein
LLMNYMAVAGVVAVYKSNWYEELYSMFNAQPE